MSEATVTEPTESELDARGIHNDGVDDPSLTDAKMAPLPPHDYNDDWDVGDIDALYRMYVDKKWSLNEIATMMGRSVGGVRSKLYRLGIGRNGYK